MFPGIRHMPLIFTKNTLARLWLCIGIFILLDSPRPLLANLLTNNVSFESNGYEDATGQYPAITGWTFSFTPGNSPYNYAGSYTAAATTGVHGTRYLSIGGGPLTGETAAASRATVVGNNAYSLTFLADFQAIGLQAGIRWYNNIGVLQREDIFSPAVDSISNSFQTFVLQAVAPTDATAAGAFMKLVNGATSVDNFSLLPGPIPSNRPPSVSAGTDQSIVLPTTATLNGAASDMDNDPVTVAWSKISGDGAVSFANATSLSTTASFSTNGIYVLRLTANDGQGHSPTDDMQITVSLPSSTNMFYVSTTGNNANPGTLTQPWRTINYAITNTQPGATIRLQAGATFTESLYFPPGSGGTPAAPKILSSDPNNRAIVRPQSTANVACYIDDTAGLRFENIRFVGDGMDVHQNDGVSAYATTARHGVLEFARCDFTGFGKCGLIIGGTGEHRGFYNVLVEDCDSYANRWDGMITYGTGLSAHTNVVFRRCRAFGNLGDPDKTTHSGSGIIIQGVTGGLVEYCTAYGNGERCTTAGGPVGIWAYQTSHVTIQYCVSYDNRAVIKDGGGFDLDGGAQNCVIQYCYSHDNDGAGFLFAQFPSPYPSTNNVVRYCISQNDGRKNGFASVDFWSTPYGTNAIMMRDVRMYGNTFFNSIAPAIQFESTNAMANIQFYNNIIMTTNGWPLVNMLTGGVLTTNVAVFKGNAYWSSGGALNLAGMSDISDWRSLLGQEMHGSTNVGLLDDPQLVSPGSGGLINNPDHLYTLVEYQLKSNSPLIDAGLNLSALFGINPGPRDYFGMATPQAARHDIGAAEFAPPPSISMIVPVGGEQFATGVTIQIMWTSNPAPAMARGLVQYTSLLDGQSPPSWTDTMENGTNGWRRASTISSVQWSQTTSAARSPSTSWFVPDRGFVTDVSLISPPLAITAGDVLSFWHQFDLEYAPYFPGVPQSGVGYDGGVVELSTNNGASWIDIGVDATQNGYNWTISPFWQSPLIGRRAFSGPSPGFIPPGATPVFNETRIPLAAFVGKTVNIRFRLGTDSIVGQVGWWIDDVSLIQQKTWQTVGMTAPGQRSIAWITPSAPGTNFGVRIMNTASGYFAWASSTAFTLTDALLADSDGDQIPDWWETQWGIGPTNMLASRDDDGDGHDNLSEYIADTLPTNSYSYHHISQMNAGGTSSITFPSSTGRLYSLITTTNLIAGEWSVIASNITGTLSMTTLTDTGASPARAYGIRVRLP
jgi:hypothetical protein